MDRVNCPICNGLGVENGIECEFCLGAGNLLRMAKADLIGSLIAFEAATPADRPSLYDRSIEDLADVIFANCG